MALIRFDQVAKRFANGTLALDGLSLDVRAGEFLTLLGPSGCGKSTALRLAAGLAAPSSGRIQGRETSVGFVFQEPTLMPWSTVAGNVALPLRIAGLPAVESRERVSEALSLVGLQDFAHVYPRELSGGMKMRVSIARAMVTRPSLLLMDEPFAALDEMTRGKLNDEVLALWRQHGLTVIFVTHSVYESVYLSSRIVVLSSRPGRIADEIIIDEPYPRDDLFRTSVAYGQYCRRVSSSLRATPSERAAL